MLPPKPHSGKMTHYQQRISLGYKGSPAGIKRAEADALRLASDLITGKFSWADWIDVFSANTVTVGEILERFKNEYLSKHSITSWSNYWGVAYKWLPSDKKLNLDLMVQVLNRHDRSSRSRQVAFIALNLLAKYLKMDVDLSPYKSTYNQSSLNERDIPSDDEIIEWHGKIPDPLWKNAFAIYATYGLRNHEIFFLEFNLPKIEVKEGKTGSRFVYPIPISWIDLFAIGVNCSLPVTSRDTHKGMGQTVTNYFRRLGVPFGVYALRHAWAIRAIRSGIPDAIAAKAMGHSLEVHSKTYQRWVGEREMDAIFISSQAE